MGHVSTSSHCTKMRKLRCLLPSDIGIVVGARVCIVVTGRRSLALHPHDSILNRAQLEIMIFYAPKSNKYLIKSILIIKHTFTKWEKPFLGKIYYEVYLGHGPSQRYYVLTWQRGFMGYTAASHRKAKGKRGTLLFKTLSISLKDNYTVLIWRNNDCKD